MKKYDIDKSRLWCCFVHGRTIDKQRTVSHHEYMDDHSAVHLILIGLLVLVIVNLFILDLKLFSPQGAIRVADMQAAATPAAHPKIVGQDTCGPDCQRVVEQKVQEALNSLASPSPKQVLEPIAARVIRESYVPLGSGSTTKSTWDNLSATETWIDTSSYGTISNVTFIAGLRNPTKNGEVEVQLYNVTDNHPVWGSHIVMSNNTSQTITSGPVQLDMGKKLYRVQIKSSLSYDAYLDSAKLRIVSQ